MKRVQKRTVRALIATPLLLSACGEREASSISPELSQTIKTEVIDASRQSFAYYEDNGPKLGLDPDMPTYDLVFDDDLTDEQCDGANPYEALELSYCWIDNTVTINPRAVNAVITAFGLDPNLGSDRQSVIEIIASHEGGHRVQDLLGDTNESEVAVELQADCFAGGAVASMHPEPGYDFSTQLTIVAMTGDNPGDPASHGTPQQRVGAFALGLESGIEACVL